MEKRCYRVEIVKKRQESICDVAESAIDFL